MLERDYTKSDLKAPHYGLSRTADPGLNIRIGSRTREGTCSYRQGLEREVNRIKK